MAKTEDVKLQRNYQREIKSLLRTIRFKSKDRRQDEFQQAVRRLQTIANVLARELKRELSPEMLTMHQQPLNLYARVQRQQRSETDKIYSLHEPRALCISKGKGHKKYKFSAKASVMVNNASAIVVGASSFQNNPFERHALSAVLSQVESIVGQRLTTAKCDRAYWGKLKTGANSTEFSESGKRKMNTSNKRQARERFRRRTAIEPIIGHLKNDQWMLRDCFQCQIDYSANQIQYFLPQIISVHASNSSAVRTSLFLTSYCNISS